MIGMLLPEIVIYDILTNIVKLLRKDVSDHSSDEANSILYKLFAEDESGKELKLNTYKVYAQAKAIINNKGNLSVNYGYNQKVANMLSLHILLPSENATMTIGADEGYLKDDVIEGGELVGRQMYYTQTFKSTYQILITSNNSAEVMVIYNILKCMLLMLVDELEFKGLRIPEFSGNDIMMQDDVIPVPIFHKVINISFQYEHNVPKLFVDDIARKLHFIAQPIND